MNFKKLVFTAVAEVQGRAVEDLDEDTPLPDVYAVLDRLSVLVGKGVSVEDADKIRTVGDLIRSCQVS